MFKPQDFEVPLEMQLKLRVVTDEVRECRDVEALQEHVIKTTELLAKYQHLLNSTLKNIIDKEINEAKGKVENS